MASRYGALVLSDTDAGAQARLKDRTPTEWVGWRRLALASGLLVAAAVSYLAVGGASGGRPAAATDLESTMVRDVGGVYVSDIEAAAQRRAAEAAEAAAATAAAPATEISASGQPLVAAADARTNGFYLKDQCLRAATRVCAQCGQQPICAPCAEEWAGAAHTHEEDGETHSNWCYTCTWETAQQRHLCMEFVDSQTNTLHNSLRRR